MLDVFAKDAGDDDGFTGEGQYPTRCFLRNSSSAIGISELQRTIAYITAASVIDSVHPALLFRGSIQRPHD